MRDDIHSTKNFQPSDYEVIEHFGVMSFDDGDGFQKESYGYEAVESVYEKGGQNADNPHPSPTQCDICGAHFVHGAVLVHAPTGKAITIGGQCLSTIAQVAHLTAGQKLYAAKRAHTKRERAGKLRTLLSENPGINAALKTDHYITQSLRSSALQWGSMSEKQVALAFKIQKDEAEKPAEAPTIAMPVTDERITVTATILGTKMVDGFYGETEKMLIRVEGEGGSWKGFGTCPAKITDAQFAEDRRRKDLDMDGCWPQIKGTVITFTALFEPSSDDPAFGFFKRPTKLTVARWGDA